MLFSMGQGKSLTEDPAILLSFMKYPRAMKKISKMVGRAGGLKGLLVMTLGCILETLRGGVATAYSETFRRGFLMKG